MTENTKDNPWESAPIPEAEHLYECVNVTGWHDEAFYFGNNLYWYQGDEKFPAGWMCRLCHRHIRSDQYGFDSPEAEATFSYLRTIPSLEQEIERRFGEGMWEWSPLEAMRE